MEIRKHYRNRKTNNRIKEKKNNTSQIQIGKNYINKKKRANLKNWECQLEKHNKSRKKYNWSWQKQWK